MALSETFSRILSSNYSFKSKGKSNLFTLLSTYYYHFITLITKLTPLEVCFDLACYLKGSNICNINETSTLSMIYLLLLVNYRALQGLYLKVLFIY